MVKALGKTGPSYAPKGGPLFVGYAPGLHFVHIMHIFGQSYKRHSLINVGNGGRMLPNITSPHKRDKLQLDACRHKSLISISESIYDLALIGENITYFEWPKSTSLHRGRA